MKWGFWWNFSSLLIDFKGLSIFNRKRLFFKLRKFIGIQSVPHFHSRKWLPLITKWENGSTSSSYTIFKRVWRKVACFQLCPIFVWVTRDRLKLGFSWGLRIRISSSFVVKFFRKKESRRVMLRPSPQNAHARDYSDETWIRSVKSSALWELKHRSTVIVTEAVAGLFSFIFKCRCSSISAGQRSHLWNSLWEYNFRVSLTLPTRIRWDRNNKTGRHIRKNKNCLGSSFLICKARI